MEEMMDGRELREKLEERTLELAGEVAGVVDELRMEDIWRCQAELYDLLVKGQETPGIVRAQLQHEDDLQVGDVLLRLREVTSVEQVGEVVAGWDERYWGHVMGSVGGMLLDVRSVGAQRFDEVMETRQALGPDYDQVQAYMQYGGFEEAMVVYKDRERGRFWPVKVWANADRQAKLDEKARRVLAGVDRGERPECTCGRH